MSTNNPKIEYLIDHLRSRLSASPVTHSLTITVVESRPKTTTGLFPYVEDPPKVRVQQVLVTVSADVPPPNNSGDQDAGEKKDEGRVETGCESRNQGLTNSTSSKDPHRLLICALEAYVYHVPSTSSCLVYISKVDSTGYSPNTTPNTENPAEGSTSRPKTRLPPTTYFLIKAFLSFYLPLPPSTSPQIQRPQIQRPHHHKYAYVNLFARSANQYLFPNSILGGGKKVLGGVKLCKWWKRVFEDIVTDLKEESAADYQSYLTYYLPSYDQLEARSLLGITPTSTASPAIQPSARPDWQYLPPADPSLNSLLFPPEVTSADSATSTETEEQRRKSRSLVGMLIPTFDDDPKARFLVELVINHPAAKMRTKGKRSGHMDDANDAGRKRQRLEESIPVDGAVDGIVDTSNTDGASSSSAIKDIKEKRRNDERRLRQEDAAALASVSWDNFWTRMGYRQECISNDVTGFFSMYVGLPSSAPTNTVTSTSVAQEDGEPTTSEGPHQVTHPLFSRIAAALLNHDFANRQLAIDATGRFLRQTENIVVAEIGQELWDERCIARVEKNEKGKAFQESSGTHGGGFGTAAAQPVVNVLQVKKKKKPVK
jgi:regulator of Ty1 transposition protein 109